jgi:hypothetical protein
MTLADHAEAMRLRHHAQDFFQPPLALERDLLVFSVKPDSAWFDTATA